MPAPPLAAQCFVEAAISAGVKAGHLRLDLGKQTEAAMRGGYGNLMMVCMAARLPPLPPEEVRRRLQHEKTFTQGAADVDVVDKLYRAFFEGVAGHAKELIFPDLEWGEAEARQLAAVLPRFAALETLYLNNNRLGDGGAAALAPALKEMPRLTKLKCAAPALPPASRAAAPHRHRLCVRRRSLERNGLGDEGGKALAAVLPQTKLTRLKCAARFPRSPRMPSPPPSPPAPRPEGSRACTCAATPCPAAPAHPWS